MTVVKLAIFKYRSLQIQPRIFLFTGIIIDFGWLSYFVDWSFAIKLFWYSTNLTQQIWIQICRPFLLQIGNVTLFNLLTGWLLNVQKLRLRPDSSIQSNRHLSVFFFKEIVHTQMTILSPCAHLLVSTVFHCSCNKSQEVQSNIRPQIFTVWTKKYILCSVKKKKCKQVGTAK